MLDAAGCLSASTHFVHWAAKPNLDTHTYTYTYRAILAACSIYANDLKKVAFVGRVAWHYFPMTFMANRQSCLPHCRKWTKALLSAWLHAARLLFLDSRTLHSLPHSTACSHLARNSSVLERCFCNEVVPNFMGQWGFSIAFLIFQCTPHTFHDIDSFAVVRLHTWLHDLIRNAIMKARKI